MGTLNITNSFVPSTPALATEVNENFIDVKDFAEALSTGTGMDNDFLVVAHLSDAVLAYLGVPGDDTFIISSQVFS